MVKTFKSKQKAEDFAIEHYGGINRPFWFVCETRGGRFRVIFDVLGYEDWLGLGF